jgi:ABC-type amino acid transport substrate-binding protein
MKNQSGYFTLVLLAVLFLTACSGTTSPTPQPVDTPTAVAETGSLQAILDRGVLKVAINPGIAPMEFERDGEVVGFDVDLAQEIGQQLGVRVELVVYESLIDITDAVEAGDFQGNFDLVISAMGIEDKRTKHTLAVPYYLSGLTILTSKATDDISNLQSLSGKKVGAVTGSSEHGIVAIQVPDAVLVDAPNYNAAISSLQAGETEAAVMDVPVALLAAKKNDSLRVVPKPFEDEWYGIYMEDAELFLFDELNRIIRDLKESGVYDSIFAKWF